MRSLETCTHVILMPKSCIYTPKILHLSPWILSPNTHSPMLVVSIVSIVSMLVARTSKSPILAALHLTKQYMMLFTRTLPLSLTRHNQLFRSEITYFMPISPARSSWTHYKTGWDHNNNRQPLLHVKYNAIMIIKGLLTPWQDVAIQVFSANGEGRGNLNHFWWYLNHFRWYLNHFRWYLHHFFLAT